MKNKMRGGIVKVLLYFIGIFAALGIIFAIVISMLPAHSMMTKGFLISIRHNQYAQAYALFSDDFKHKVDFQNFVKSIENSGLQQNTDYTLTSEVVTDKQATLKAMVLVKSNKRIPLTIEFAKQEKK